MALSDSQIERYGRQILLPQVGGKGQERLLGAAVSISGAHRGSEEAAQYLAAAGVGHLRMEEALREKIEPEIRARNPDVHVSASLEGAVCVSSDGTDRASGALAALRTLVSIIGAGQYSRFSWEKHRWWTS